MTRPGPDCLVYLLRVNQPAMVEQIDELIAAVAAGAVYGTTAAKVLHDKLGANISGQTIRRHATRTCTCHR